MFRVIHASNRLRKPTLQVTYMLKRVEKDQCFFYLSAIIVDTHQTARMYNVIWVYTARNLYPPTVIDNGRIVNDIESIKKFMYL